MRSPARVLLAAWVAAQLVSPAAAQFSQYKFLVRFPVISSELDRPHVKCGSGQPRDSGSCKRCKDDNLFDADPGLCINSFEIITTYIDPFTGLDVQETICNPTDANGNVIDLGANEYRIFMQTKSPSYNAPSGVTLGDLGTSLSCNEGVWTVEYVTTIAGQYQLSVSMFSGFQAGTGAEILTPLQDEDAAASPFEIEATHVMPSALIPQNFFVDNVLSLRPVCTAESIDCAHCLNPTLNGGCPGNEKIPTVRGESQMLLQPGDAYFNPVDDQCLYINSITSSMTALKTPEMTQTGCTGDTCTGTSLIQRPVGYTIDSTVLCNLNAPYLVQFQVTYSGFYTLSLTGPTALGPLVIPVDAAAVDFTQTFAAGNGLFQSVQTEQATFRIQPMDTYGNHHTSGLHVFTIQISRLDANFRTTVTPVDSGKGYLDVSYQLEAAAQYEVSIRYCKDLTHYPPYLPTENRVCDLDTLDGQGPNIKGSPHIVTILPVEFFIPGSTQPGLMEEFLSAVVGTRYFALFTGNFPTCGETYGNPTINDRYLPTIRFDIGTLQYRFMPPPNPILTEFHVSTADLLNGNFEATQYGDYAQKCLDGGYIFTFMLTRSGVYNVWLYADSTAPRTVAESPRRFEMLPEVRVIENFIASGAAVNCELETDCMASAATTFVVQAKDRFGNDATSCDESIVINVIPVSAEADHFIVQNLVEEYNVGGVPINGVPGPGVDIQTLSGYLAQPIFPFSGTIASCDAGTYNAEIYATLAAEYTVHVTVNDVQLQGTPFPLTIFPQQQDLTFGESKLGLATYNRWTYYRVNFDEEETGFNVEVVKTDDNSGQPWTYLRWADIFAELQEPDETAGIRFEYPLAFSSIYCRNCRIHVPPTKGKQGYWFVAVYGHEDDSFHTVTVNPYPMETLEPSVFKTGTVNPGQYYYYKFTVTTTSGFQVRVTTVDTTQGEMTASLKKGSPPTQDTDIDSIFGQALWSPNCQDCIIDHPPTFTAEGEWYLAILGHIYSVNFQVALLEFSETAISFGSQSNELTLPSFSWGYYTFTIDPDLDPDGFKLEVIPTDAKYNLTTVLKKSQHPITLTDTTFRPDPCTHCRITIMTRQALQATWYVGIYAGATGGTFQLKVKIVESCPNDCFGNGECVQRKTRVCVCYPGYTGIDCRDPIKEKIFAWYPLDIDTKDVTENQTPLFYKVNLDGQLSFVQGGVSLSDTYIVIPKPTPAVYCAPFMSPQATDEKNFQWGQQVDVDVGTGNMRVDETIPAEGEWYQWNELGDPEGNPRENMTCAEYNPRRELTVMFKIRVDFVQPSPGSFAGLGKASRIIGRTDADKNGQWAWFVFPQRHPDGEHVVFDMYLRNATHEISMRENAIYPIDGNIIFEKADYWTRTFPDEWCIDGPKPTRSDGICEYMEMETWYHIAAVFGPRKAELWAGGILIGSMDLDLWNITDVVDGRIHFGHDPRYAFYERLFFGQLRDIRILRYTASAEEIRAVVDRGEEWFTWRETERSATGIEYNLGSIINPIPLSALDDGSMEHDAFAHEDVCRQYRAPNEPRDMQLAANCPFIDTDTSWILRETYDRNYRKYDTDRMPYGLGHEELILKDTRELGDIYLGRFYDFSIDPD